MTHNRLRAATAGAAVTVTLLLAGCTAATTTQGGVTQGSTTTGTGLFDSSAVHTISVEFDQAEYDAIIAAYEADGTKDWLSATITIDGTVLENVGLRLKGNSSLRGIASANGDGEVSADDPAGIPWLIRLDKYVDGQTYDGRTELIVRGNNSETSMNEAVALELIGLAGLATQEATAVRFSVNGGDAQLRLVIESPDDETWSDDVFGEDGITYEAETEGDYSYRGEDAEAYADAFTQQTDTDDPNLQPVIDLLEFVDTATDEEFAANLGQYLDVDAFATYLAIEDLIDNFDDIAGPGNNSYLRWDAETGLITVVAWDHNLALGVTNGGPGGGMPEGGFPEGGMPDGGLPEGATPPDGVMPDGAMPGGMGARGGNPLAERFLETASFSALVDAETERLTAELYDSGEAQAILDEWVSVLSEQASDLVPTGAIESEAETISAYFE